MGAPSTEIKGDVEQIAQSSQQLKNFGTDLESTLKSIKDVVDGIAGGTYGVSAGTLTDVYYELHDDLSKFVETLDELGSNVGTSGENLSSVDTAASRGLSYDG